MFKSGNLRSQAPKQKKPKKAFAGLANMGQGTFAIDDLIVDDIEDLDAD